MNPDYELETLLALDGFQFYFAQGYWVKIAAKAMKPMQGRPHGIRYSLTLHDPQGLRIYGLDNAHGVNFSDNYDHRHVYGIQKIVPYPYQGPTKLLEDFYREVERILEERGVR